MPRLSKTYPRISCLSRTQSLSVSALLGRVLKRLLSSKFTMPSLSVSWVRDASSERGVTPAAGT